MSTLYSMYCAYEDAGIEVPDELIEAREIEWEQWEEAMMNLLF